MFGIKVKITKFTDDWNPGWVECQLTNASGKLHIFNEKVPVVTVEYLDKNSVYPQVGIVGCEIIEEKNIDGREIIKVTTELPWYIESINGENIFEVLKEQITEFEHISNFAEHLFIPFQNKMISVKYHLQNLYEAFNKREIETVLSMMAENVKWANGMEGGFIDGRENVREYWRKQFELINPQLKPREFETDERGRNVVTVHQIVRDLNGNLLIEKTIKQIFTIENGLITVFEIENSEPFIKTINQS